MNTLQKAIAGVFAAAAMVSGNSIGQVVVYDSTPSYVQTNPAYTGVVESIDVARSNNGGGNNVAGTILGGVIGGVIGHQFGSGRGNDAATIAGALGGAAVGHEVAENRGGRDAYRVDVRLDNGGLRSFYQDSVYGLNVGERVQIANERVYRFAGTTYRNDVQPYRSEYRADERGYRVDGGVRYDNGARNDSGTRYDNGTPYTYDNGAQNGYRAVDEPVVRYMPNGRLDRRVYSYDGQGYRLDQWGNRYDAEGYWVDERGNRYEYQDPPMSEVPPNRLNHPQ